MTIGVASGPDRLDKLNALGYDRIELGVSQIVELPPDGIQRLKRRLAEKTVALRSCNCLIPGGFTPLYRDEGLRDSRAYLTRVMPILADVGVQTAAFGSGWFRRMPDDLPHTRRHALVRDFLVLAASIARESGITLAVEPLNRGETNILNTTDEATAYLRELELPNLKLLVDLYHFYQVGEPLEHLYACAPYIRHIHIAEPTRRDFVRRTDAYDYAAFFRVLKEIGYDGAVILEGGKGDFDAGATETYSVLRAYADAAL